MSENVYSGVEKLQNLLSLLQRAQQTYVDFNDDIKRVKDALNNAKGNDTRIVLLGNVSDGKTTTIAGLFGMTTPEMKIDIDESSDQLVMLPLKPGYQIVDTPGLFGTKETEVDGRTLRYSRITEEYISQAHIILYVCGAVNPIKESHAPIIRHVLRDLGKLENTIFVVNKMDEAGVDMMDEEEYNTASEIKRRNVIGRLREMVQLLPMEEEKLQVVCIAADPKQKGLKYWLARPDNYSMRSHMDQLRAAINSILATSDRAQLADQASYASVHDIAQDAMARLTQAGQELGDQCEQSNSLLAEKKDQLDELKIDLGDARELMTRRILSLKQKIFIDVSHATPDTIANVVEDELGVQDGKVTFYLLIRQLHQIMNDCTASCGAHVEPRVVQFNEIGQKNDMILMSAKTGMNILTQIRTSRTAMNVAALTAKTETAVATTAANTTAVATRTAVGAGSKFLGSLALGVEVGIAGYEWWKSYKDSKELERLQTELKNAVTEIINDVFDTFNDDEKYYENYAPQYNDLCKDVDTHNEELEEINRSKENIDSLMFDMENFIEVID